MQEFNKLESLVVCPLCKSQESTPFLTGKDIIYALSPDIFSYVSCQDCSLVYLQQRVHESDLSSIYPDDYAPYATAKCVERQSGREEDAVVRLFGSSLIPDRVQNICSKVLGFFFKDKISSELARVFSRTETGKLILDFGCGSDVFLNKMRALGWETIGMDFNVGTIGDVVSSGHKGVLFNDELAWNEIQDDSIDVIRLNHVVEHLYEPSKILDKLYSKLRNGGIIYMSTPNINGVSATRFKSNWWGLDCPRHVMLFSPNTLQTLLTKSGFSESRIYHESISKDYVRSLAFELVGDAGIKMDAIIGLDANTKLVRRYAIKTKIASIFGKGDRFHVFSKKMTPKSIN